MAGRKNDWVIDKTPLDEIVVGQEYFFSEMEFRILRNYSDPPGEGPGIIKDRMRSAIVGRLRYLDKQRDRANGIEPSKKYFVGDRWELRFRGYKTIPAKQMNASTKCRHTFRYEDEKKRGCMVCRIR